MNIRSHILKHLEFEEEELQPRETQLRQHTIFSRARAVQEVLESHFTSNPDELEATLEDAVELLNEASERLDIIDEDAHLHGYTNTILLPDYTKSKATGEIVLGKNGEYEDDTSQPPISPLQPSGHFAGFDYRILVPPEYESDETKDDDSSNKELLFSAEIVYQLEIDRVRTYLGRMSVYIAGNVCNTDITFDTDTLIEAREAALTRLSKLYEVNDDELRMTLDTFLELFDEGDVNSQEGFATLNYCVDYILNIARVSVKDETIVGLMDYIKHSFDLNNCVSVTTSKIYDSDYQGSIRKSLDDGDSHYEIPLASADLICLPKMLMNGNPSRLQRDVYLATGMLQDNGDEATIYIPLGAILDLEPSN